MNAAYCCKLHIKIFRTLFLYSTVASLTEKFDYIQYLECIITLTSVNYIATSQSVQIVNNTYLVHHGI